LIIPAVATLFLHVPFLTLRIPWPENSNPFRKLLGWRQLGAQVATIVQSMDKPCFILADYYMTASELAFYTKGRPAVYCVNLGRRMNQYDLWAGFDRLVGQNAVYVTDEGIAPALAAAFERVDMDARPIRDDAGRTIKSFVAYRCYGFKGWTGTSPMRY